MPYRNLHPLRRPWWEKLTGLWMVILAGMGIHALVIINAFPRLRLGQATFAALLMALGVAAFAAWWKGARQPELIFMTGLAILSLAHGGALWVLTDDAGAQAGLRIIAAGFGTLAWVGIRRDYAIGRSQLPQIVDSVIEGRDDREG